MKSIPRHFNKLCQTKTEIAKQDRTLPGITFRGKNSDVMLKVLELCGLSKKNS